MPHLSASTPGRTDLGVQAAQPGYTCGFAGGVYTTWCLGMTGFRKSYARCSTAVALRTTGVIMFLNGVAGPAGLGAATAACCSAGRVGVATLASSRRPGAPQLVDASTRRKVDAPLWDMGRAKAARV